MPHEARPPTRPDGSNVIGVPSLVLNPAEDDDDDDLYPQSEAQGLAHKGVMPR